MKKRVILGFSVVFASLTASAALNYAWPMLEVGTAYKAKGLCSEVFLSGRSPDEVLSTDYSYFPANLVSASVNMEEQTATASALGLVSATVVYRPGCGCTIARDTTVDALKAAAADVEAPVRPDLSDIEWPLGDYVSANIPQELDQDRLNEIVDAAFIEPGGDGQLGTRAVVVVYKDQIVAEKYAPGFDKDTRFIGWSLTKTATSAFIGALVKDDKLDVFAPVPITEWEDPADPRHDITIDHLMRMCSGIEFKEDYSDYSGDALTMLYRRGDYGAYAATKDLEGAPGTVFNYSSGSSALLSLAVKNSLQLPDAEYMMTPRKALFEKVGMYSAELESDASGSHAAASFMYATARDWARLGLLYLHNGEWNGEQLLPEDWVSYSITPTPASGGKYGVSWWLNKGKDEDTIQWPNLGEEAYAAIGYEGQMIMILPKDDLVIVRMGQSRPKETFEVESLVLPVLSTIDRSYSKTNHFVAAD